ncbi:hypothetical protein F2Q69_00023725 [Brassica cretica]|uniref:Uncharacterized protein n=1 Tax=Brassica cretica TaxID=69181 RepID=A0A8S9QFI4_BRACR|nr:hypothetical protein F2Q69_00023725 [Brassica cretica]
MDPEQRNTHSSTRRRSELDRMHRPTRPFGELDQSNSSNGRVGLSKPSNSPIRRVGLSKSSNSSNGLVGPNMQSNSPVRRVGSINPPSSRPRSSLLRGWIEPALVSFRSESSQELYDLKTARTRYLILLYKKPLRKKPESSDKSSRRIVTQRPNACSIRSLRSDLVRAKAHSLHSDQTPIPLGLYVATVLEPELSRYVAIKLESELGRYVATELEPKFGRYVATELEPKFGRYVATELFRNVDTTSVHAFSSTLRCYLRNTVANPSHVLRHF